MSVYNGVHLGDPLPNRLFTEVWRGVNQDGVARVLEHDRWAGTLVVRVGGVAYRTITADCGYPHRGTAAQHGKCCLHRDLGAALGPGWGGRASEFVTSTYAIRSS